MIKRERSTNVTCTVRIDEKLFEDIRLISLKTDRSFSYLAKISLTRLVKNWKEKIPDYFPKSTKDV